MCIYRKRESERSAERQRERQKERERERQKERERERARDGKCVVPHDQKTGKGERERHGGGQGVGRESGICDLCRLTDSQTADKQTEMKKGTRTDIQTEWETDRHRYRQ